jgi:hypothetical protein
MTNSLSSMGLAETLIRFCRKKGQRSFAGPSMEREEFFRNCHRIKQLQQQNDWKTKVPGPNCFERASSGHPFTFF